MALLTMCLWGHPILKTRAKEITEVTDEIRRLAQDMLETMRAYNGVGLAGNQVGVAKRIFVVEVPSKNGASVQHVLINPVITYRSKKKETQDEGCLSFPDISGPVERSEEVEVTGKDLDGKEICVRGSGLLARAIQHEFDHLDGIVFIERMPIVHRLRLNKQLKALAHKTRQLLAQAQAAKV